MLFSSLNMECEKYGRLNKSRDGLILILLPIYNTTGNEWRKHDNIKFFIGSLAKFNSGHL